MAVLSTPLGHADLLEIPAYYERFYAYFAPGSGIAEGRLNVADMPLDQLWVLQEGHCIRNQIFNFCGKASSYNHVYEAGSIDTLVRIVDRNGGYTQMCIRDSPWAAPCSPTTISTWTGSRRLMAAPAPWLRP